MMAPWRVVLVKDAHLFTPNQVKVLIPYCEKPSPTTCLILVGESPGPWKGHLKVLEKKGRVVSFPHPGGSALTRYIFAGAKQMGKEISSEAADVMRELVGSHLGEIYQELDKLASYTGERKEIGVDDVEAVISRVRIHTVFDLTRALGMKNCPDACLEDPGSDAGKRRAPLEDLDHDGETVSSHLDGQGDAISRKAGPGHWKGPRHTRLFSPGFTCPIEELHFPGPR